MNIFAYEFMQRAFIVGIALAIIIPLIGLIMVLKRSSMIGDTLAHTSLAGVAAGLLIGFNPIVGAVVACVIAVFAIEGIQKKLPKNKDLGMAVVLTVGISVAGLLTTYIPSGVNFNSYLFGSIALVSQNDLILIVSIAAVILLVFLIIAKDLYLLTLDEKMAKLSGVKVSAINFLFTLLTAVTVGIAAKTVGALIVSSLMILPAACAMQFEKGFFKTLLLSVGFGVLYTISGLFVAFYANQRAGATIVLIGAIIFLIIVMVKWIINKIRLGKLRRING
ncbi:MAG: metal ABC transporter permease [Bacilli bacterium]|jgi:zinc transport system permease protein|nr:metal ABC transporter permease [Bacilli bacterium]HOC81059.1 metal ABC transporter permease [Bacilli bacterium]